MDRKVKIGYMVNPDKVFYSEIDDEIMKRLEICGAEIVKLNLEDINFAITSEKIEFFSKNEKLFIDGFLNYGYMSKFHYEAFIYVISSLEAMGITCLHSIKNENILNNKYIQALCYSKAGIPIPSTNIGFSVDSFKNISATTYPTTSIMKKLDDYGGDGVSRHLNRDNLVNSASKLLWKNEYCIFQEYVRDSPGKSVRVLCIDGKGIACAEYNDKTNNFKSNNSYGYEFFSLDSLMESSKLKDYYELAEKAVRAIGNLTIGGVDILDSEEKGMIVLEVNGWPDIYDLAEATKIDIFEKFTNAFYKKVEKSVNII